MPSPNGEMVKEIRVISRASALPGSQSALHGTGRFPLHTDTVFWPVPVRYVLLRGSGDTRRTTTVLTFDELFAVCGRPIVTLAEKSVWLAGKNAKPFYCAMRLHHPEATGWRYDIDNMCPENAAAREVDLALRQVVQSGIGNEIHWSGDSAVILSNWNVLHGRGPEPPSEGPRTIERLYVR